MTKPADFRPQLAKQPTKTSITPEEAMANAFWDVERKWDGMRAVFHILPSEDTTLIFTRNGLSLVPQFPELQNLHKLFFYDCILDGEIVAIRPGTEDEEDLELLQMRAGDKNAKRIDEIPVTVKFFDIIRMMDTAGKIWDGTASAHSDRLAVLAGALEGTGYALPELLTEMPIPEHWEGVVLKSHNSLYKPGKRTAEWLKYKAVKRATLKATGLTPGLGNRADHFGAVLVEDANGTFRGQVGSGFSDAEIAEIESWGPWWDEDPKSEWPLIEVEYRFLSKTGLLVNTAYKGHRPDKEVADVL